MIKTIYIQKNVYIHREILLLHMILIQILLSTALIVVVKINFYFKSTIIHAIFPDLIEIMKILSILNILIKLELRK